MGVIRPKINGLNVMRPPKSHPNPDHWNEIRMAALERDGFACRCCPNDSASGIPLEIHHRHYENWGKEQLEDVVTLCVTCHDAITSRIRETTEYLIAPPERVPRPDRPTVTTQDVAVLGEVPRMQRADRPTVTLGSVSVQSKPSNNLPPRDKPKR